MKKRITILIIEDDDGVCDNFTDYINPLEYMSICAITNDSDKGIELTKSRKPDIVILDLELQNGSGSGLSYLSWYRDCSLENKPLVIVTTYNSSNYIHHTIRNMGVDFIFTKYSNNYNEGFVVDQIKIIFDNLYPRNSRESALSASMSLEQETARYKRLLFDEFNKIGLLPKLSGYKYLADAVIMYKMSPIKNNFSKELSKKYCKSPSSIERAMQRAIEVTWSHSPVEDLLEHYKGRIKNDTGSPTTMEFITYYARKLDML